MSTVLFDPIKVQATVTDSVIVGFSGGKDSIVTMDLCFRYFKHVYPYFLYIVPDLSFQESMLRWYENHYNTEIIRLPHPDSSLSFRYGSFCMGNCDVPVVSINDIYHYLRLETDTWWIAAGERIDDSIIRRAMIKNSGSLDINRGRFYPVSAWSKKDVMKYIKYRHLPLGKDSKKLGFSFKSLNGKELAMVRDNFPGDYEKILQVYPFADTAVKRYDEYGQK